MLFPLRVRQDRCDQERDEVPALLDHIPYHLFYAVPILFRFHCHPSLINVGYYSQMYLSFNFLSLFCLANCKQINLCINSMLLI